VCIFWIAAAGCCFVVKYAHITHTTPRLMPTKPSVGRSGRGEKKCPSWSLLSANCTHFCRSIYLVLPLATATASGNGNGNGNVNGNGNGNGIFVPLSGSAACLSRGKFTSGKWKPASVLLLHVCLFVGL